MNVRFMVLNCDMKEKLAQSIYNIICRRVQHNFSQVFIRVLIGLLEGFIYIVNTSIFLIHALFYTGTAQFHRF